MKIQVLVPDYYNSFLCKCGECRTTCCQRWRIGLSREEYFSLIGLDVTPALRAKLDTAFHLFDDASPERYAFISHNYYGYCKILNDEGYCALQREKGEDVLPEVCRFFPRAIHRGVNGESNCGVFSAGCENTVELLMRDERLKFSVDEISIPGDHIPDGASDALSGTDRRDMFDVIDLINGEGELESKLKTLAGNDLTEEDIFSNTVRLIEQLKKTSVNLEEYSENLITDFDIFRSKIEQIKTCFPGVDNYYTNIFANHVFYIQIPHNDSLSREELFSALYYALKITQLIVASNFNIDDPRNTFSDSVAAVFRMIEHSNFYRALAHK